MTPTKGMSAEHLRDEMRERKLNAFDAAINLQRAEPSTLAASGFKHWADPILYAAKMNEARLKDWERNNPEG